MMPESIFSPVFRVASPDKPVTVTDGATGKPVDVRILRWAPPGAGHEELIVAVDLQCPRCDYPLHVPVKGAFDLSADKRLTFGQEIRCPGHWTALNSRGVVPADGMPTARCGWVGVIRNSVLHSPDCFRVDFTAAARVGVPCGDGCDGSFWAAGDAAAMTAGDGTDEAGAAIHDTAPAGRVLMPPDWPGAGGEDPLVTYVRSHGDGGEA